MADFADMFTYGVRELHAKMESQKPIVALYRDRYFPNVIESLDEMVRFEVRKKGDLVLPSVRRGDNALSLGAVAEHQVRMFEPPYHFFRASVTSQDTQKRIYGEPIGAPYSRDERAQAILAEKLTEGARRSLLLLQESYCAQLIKTGKVKAKRMAEDGTIYDAAEIDFGCDENLVGVDKTTGASASADTWTTSTDIPSQIKNLALEVFSASGRMPTEMVVGATVLTTMFGNSKFTNHYDNRRIEGGLLETIPMSNYPGAAVIGYVNVPAVGNIRILSYVNDYKYKGDNTATKMIDDKCILLTSPGWGSMGYGALNDKAENGFPTLVPGRSIIHTEFGNPSDGFTVKGFIQSAPLPVPTELDAWMYAEVV